MLRGQNDPALLACRNACARTAIVGIGTQADFNKDERLSITTDEVDFTATTVKIARQDRQPTLLQEARRLILSALADNAGRIARGIVGTSFNP
jgi:hypothetical protein